MEIIEKSGRFIDWLMRGEIVWRILVAVGGGKVLQILLATKIPEQYRTATWLLASGGILFFLIQLGRWWDGKRRLVVQTTAASPAAFVRAYVEEHRTYIDPAMLKETEDTIQNEANNLHGAERETFLLHGFSTSLLMGFYEVTWYVIFGSLIRALERLNGGPATLEQLRPYYDYAADKRQQYPFESWFSYMKEQCLLRQDGCNINITIRGKAFLKYLVQYGRTAADRPL